MHRFDGMFGSHEFIEFPGVFDGILFVLVFLFHKVNDIFWIHVLWLITGVFKFTKHALLYCLYLYYYSIDLMICLIHEFIEFTDLFKSRYAWRITFYLCVGFLLTSIPELKGFAFQAHWKEHSWLSKSNFFLECVKFLPCGEIWFLSFFNPYGT